MDTGPSDEVVELCKKFVGKPGPMYIDTHIQAHLEGQFASIDEDVWPIGKLGRAITFNDLSKFFKKVNEEIGKTEGTTFYFEGIKFYTRGKYKAQLLFGS